MNKAEIQRNCSLCKIFATSNRVISASQSTLTEPLSCAISVNILQKLRDAIVMGLRSKEAYYKCIEKGSELTLEQVIGIAQNQEATAHQVGYIRPKFKGDPLQMEVHKIQGPGHSEAKRDRQQQGFSAQSLKTGPTDRKQRKSKRETCFSCGARPPHPRSEYPAKKAKCLKCGKEGHYGSVCDQTEKMNESMYYKCSR